MSAYKVKPDAFWKRVRPVVPQDVIYATYVTAKDLHDLLHRRGGSLTSARPARGYLRQLGCITSTAESQRERWMEQQPR